MFTLQLRARRELLKKLHYYGTIEAERAALKVSLMAFGKFYHPQTLRYDKLPANDTEWRFNNYSVT
jgi:hypothetical protein